jgi:hypothetical protein
MIPRKYKVILTNGRVNHTYNVHAGGEKAAIILARAEAINMARGFELVHVVEVDCC